VNLDLLFYAPHPDVQIGDRIVVHRFRQLSEISPSRSQSFGRFRSRFCSSFKWSLALLHDSDHGRFTS